MINSLEGRGSPQEIPEVRAPNLADPEVNPLADHIAAAMSKAGLGIRQRDGVPELKKVAQN